MNNIIPLTWDTDFFNRNIGQIHLSTVDSVYSFQDEFHASSFELVYATTETESLTNKVVELFGLVPIEYKRTYSLNHVPSLIPASQYEIVEIKELSPRLKELTFQSGKESRFFKDANIGIVDFEKLYATWIEKSINGALADHVVGVLVSNQLVGFATLAFKIDFAQVGLIAVHTDFRGKGIAKTLMNICISYTQAAGKMPLKVVTQAHNISACRLYESMGFKELSSIPLFHIWKSHS
jgi:dTDP-4-amino-4,6-dideoxy-D-galactose acyltransferase